MRYALPLLSSLALLATGCERYPEDPVFAYGRVLHPDGSPMAGQTFTLERVLNDHSLDPTQLERPAFTPYGPFTSEANGDLNIEVLAGHTEELHSYEYKNYRFRLATPLEDGVGAFLSFSFDDDVELPPLQPWAANPTVSDGPAGLSVSFPPPPPPPEPPATAHLIRIYSPDGPGAPDLDGTEMEPTTPKAIMRLTNGDGLLWQENDVRSPWTTSPYVLEDFAAPELGLRAVSVGEWNFEPLGGQTSHLSFRLEWRGKKVPLTPGTLRPVSRGASCAPIRSPCPWTDGKLVPMVVANEQGFNQELIVTLDQPARLKRAVLRALSTPSGYQRVRLEGSEDKQHWTVLAESVVRDEPLRDLEQIAFSFFGTMTSADSPFDEQLRMDASVSFADLPLQDHGPVRYVRLSVITERGPALYVSLAELSLFE